MDEPIIDGLIIPLKRTSPSLIHEVDEFAKIVGTIDRRIHFGHPTHNISTDKGNGYKVPQTRVNHLQIKAQKTKRALKYIVHKLDRIRIGLSGKGISGNPIFFI